MKKLYIINKYVIAESAEQAIKLEKKQKPDEVFFDSDWKKGHINKSDDEFWNK